MDTLAIAVEAVALLAELDTQVIRRDYSQTLDIRVSVHDGRQNVSVRNVSIQRYYDGRPGLSLRPVWD